MSRIVPLVALLGMLAIECASESSTSHRQDELIEHECTTQYLACLSVDDSLSCLQSLRDKDSGAEEARRSLIKYLQEANDVRSPNVPLVLFSPVPDFSDTNERVRTGPYHFELAVNENGTYTVRRLSSSSGSAKVDEILNKSARKVIVVPAFENGTPVKSLVLITFHLN